MLGRNHLIANTSTAASLWAITSLCQSSEIWHVKTIGEWFSQGWSYLIGDGSPLYMALCFIFFFIGTLLPDIDNGSSLFGRKVRLPVRHRTWTHSLYPVIVFGILSIWWRPIGWLAFGYLGHLFWDSLSAMGVCWFYPLPGYESYGNAQVKRGHWLKLYKAGEITEYVWVVIGVIVAVCLSALAFV